MAEVSESTHELRITKDGLVTTAPLKHKAFWEAQNLQLPESKRVGIEVIEKGTHDPSQWKGQSVTLNALTEKDKRIAELEAQLAQTKEVKEPKEPKEPKAKKEETK